MPITWKNVGGNLSAPNLYGASRMFESGLGQFDDLATTLQENAVAREQAGIDSNFADQKAGMFGLTNRDTFQQDAMNFYNNLRDADAKKQFLTDMEARRGVLDDRYTQGLNDTNQAVENQFQKQVIQSGLDKDLANINQSNAAASASRLSGKAAQNKLDTFQRSRENYSWLSANEGKFLDEKGRVDPDALLTAYKSRPGANPVDQDDFESFMTKAKTITGQTGKEELKKTIDAEQREIENKRNIELGKNILKRLNEQGLTKEANWTSQLTDSDEDIQGDYFGVLARAYQDLNGNPLALNAVMNAGGTGSDFSLKDAEAELEKQRRELYNRRFQK